MYTLVNQEKALVGAFSVIVKTGFGTDGSLVRVLGWCCGWTQGEAVSAAPGPLEAATLGWGLTAVRRHHRSPPPPPAPAYHQYPVGNITRAHQPHQHTQHGTGSAEPEPAEIISILT